METEYKISLSVNGLSKECVEGMIADLQKIMLKHTHDQIELHVFPSVDHNIK